MNRMFSNCFDFNQSVANFNTSSVISMSSMFSNCMDFNQSVINFDTVLVEDMSSMFVLFCI